jgi:hypothetical protein
MYYDAKIILDSQCGKHRLTTMVLTYPRIIHSEVMTHCMFVRNAASSRAIPVEKQIKIVEETPFIPEWFGKAQKGMQAEEEISAHAYKMAVEEWLVARDNAVMKAKFLLSLGMHKNIPNRLLEPFNWITTVLSGTDDAYANFFAQRCHPAAEKHFQKIAYMAQLLYFTSAPRTVDHGYWHTPFILPDEYTTMDVDTRCKVSVARVARVSYRQHDTDKVDVNKDLERYGLLRYSKPMHMSPFSHVATAATGGLRYANFTGWIPYRRTIVGEYIETFEPNHPDLVDDSDKIKWSYPEKAVA